MAKSIRTTVSVPSELYSSLAKFAEDSHVSTAWVIRDALRAYLSNRATILDGSTSTPRKGAKRVGSK